MDFVGGSIVPYNEEKYDISKLNINNIEDLKYITGPVKMTVLTGLNRIIYLIGDVHIYTNKGFECEPYNEKKEYNNNSLYFPDYLFRLIQKNKKEQFDVFIELAYAQDKKKSSYEEGMLENINRLFEICLEDLNYKDPCRKKFPNLRFHAMDIRKYSDNFIGDNISLVTSFRNWMDDNKKNQVNIKLNREHVIFISKFIGNKDGTYDNIDKKFWELIGFSDKLKKNFMDMPDKKVKEVIMNYYSDKIKKLINPKLNVEIKLMMLTNGKEEMNFEKDNYDALFYFFIEYGVYIMDIYILGRLFKKFNDPDKNKQFTKNSVIIAGNSHIKNYEEVLKKIGFNVVFNYEVSRTNIDSMIDHYFELEKEGSTELQKRCIDLDNSNFLKKIELPKDNKSIANILENIRILYNRKNNIEKMII